MIYGSRVRHARLFLGETQAQFAAVVGMAQSQLSAVENDAHQLGDEGVVLAISEHTGFPPDFFECAPDRPIDNVQFRARLTFKAADRNRVMSCADILHESYARMRKQLEVLQVRVERSVGLDPRQAARSFRKALLLPSGPIPNLTSPVERHGVVILALPVVGKKHDAFSTWHMEGDDSYPLIATLAGSPGDRIRWNIAHEIGHLLLHNGGSGQDIEREADTFAAELLTPMDAMSAEIPMRPKLSALYAMKLRWGVSVQSLIRRAREVERVTGEQYTSLFRQVSARGERMSERYQITREKPRMYRKMAEVLYGDLPAPGLSALCAWTEEFAMDVLEQYASKSEIPSRRVLVSQRTSQDRSNVVELHGRSRRSN